ncbi:MAG: hypothetical protein RMK29_17440 [Myxococcales bacterium]|nr:class II glutamine amidotransferase [Myxococcota bacterium]MDW8283495.1 hypothetical protein [Myxococcales bacterium]
MSRLIAYIGSDPERLRAALLEYRALLLTAPVEATEGVVGWGIGFYQGGEVLLQRRPRVSAGVIDLFEVVKDLRTDLFLAQIQHTSESRLAKNENTPPYRFRSWIMVQQGSAHGLRKAREEALQLLPDFLKRNIRGQTAAEQLFHVFLASLHEAGRGHLEDPNLPPEIALRALQSALDRLRQLALQPEAGAEGADEEDLQVVVSNGRILISLRRGPQPVWMRRLGPTLGDRHHEPFRGVLVASGPGLVIPEGSSFEELPAGQAILVGRDLMPRIVPLDSPPGSPSAR